MSNEPVNYRQQPQQYDINASDDDALMSEPYHAEIMSYLRAGTTDEAAESAAVLYELYLRYKESGDFVGMDIVRRALKRGLTLARQVMSEGAVFIDSVRPPPDIIFHKTYRMVDRDPDFLRMKARHIAAYEAR